MPYASQNAHFAKDAAVTASSTVSAARRIGAALASLTLAAGLALALAPAASANGYPLCTADDFPGSTGSPTGDGVVTIAGDVTSKAGGTKCDGQIVVAAGTTATLNLGDFDIYSPNDTSVLKIERTGTLTITGSGTLKLTSLPKSDIVDAGAGIENSGTLTIAGGTVEATGANGWNQYAGGAGIENFGTMTVVGGSLTATGGGGGDGGYGGDGIRNNNDATLVATVVPELNPGSGGTDGLPLRNWSRIVMPVPETAYAGFAAGDAQAAVDANNAAATPRVLYLFDHAPARGLRSPTHALRTPLLRTPSTSTTVGDVVGVLGTVSDYWPEASSDYTFTGWYDAATGGSQFRADDTTLISSFDTPTFYAHWTSTQQSSQSSQGSSTQTPTTTSTPATTATTTPTTKTTLSTPKTTPTTTSAFTPTNNAADPYTFTSTAAPSAPPLPTASSANDGSGSQLGLNHSSVQQSGDFTATATGFKPGSVADFFLWSTPVYLGSAVADIHGVAVLHIALKPAYVGEHHVQVVGTGLQGQPRNLAQAITVTAPPALAETGINAAWLLGPALLLLLLGVGLTRVGRRDLARRH